MPPNNDPRYSQIIAKIFETKFREGRRAIRFERTEIVNAARDLGIELPKNLGDVIYSFKFRNQLPDSIKETAPDDKEWVIVNRGRSQYAFELKGTSRILPDPMLTITKIPDATPGIVAKYSFDDEQALLTKLRYNRMLDIFTGIACYSLQNHLRTTVPGVGQIETDEIYVGIDKKGVHYVFPVQAKSGKDTLGVVQIEQDIALCNHRFPTLICRAIAAQFLQENVIALFELELIDGEVRKASERHYQLVPQEYLTDEELMNYRLRFDDP